MYNYEWDSETGGYILTTQTGKYVANEVRPVFAEELKLTGLAKYLKFDLNETRPFLWAQKNIYYYHGEKIAKFNNLQLGKPMEIERFFIGKKMLLPVDIDAMAQKNAEIMGALVGDTKRRIKELYDLGINSCDKAYIAFSGGKDSMVLLHLCQEVLPLDVPVIFSDTDMELPDTYDLWHKVQECYPNRTFICAKADNAAIKNWDLFGPPSRTIRWCCSVHKSTPALICLKKIIGTSAIRVMAFVGVRGEESYSRSFYEDSNDGIKNASQMNKMPLLDWGAHEIWLYIFQNNIMSNNAYRKGLSRVGCAMCPESSEKYLWFVNKSYPKLIKPYVDIIFKTSAKTFSGKEEKREYIASQKWQARKSGVTLLNTITSPVESIEGLKMIFKSSYFNEQMLFTWIKPLGTVVKDPDTTGYKLKIPNTLDEGIPFRFASSHSTGGILQFEFRTKEELMGMLPLIRTMLRKVSACVGCRVCESECIHGALYYAEGTMRIDEQKCVHCRQCFDKIDKGCWRYKSMFKSETDNKNQLNSINRYNNFGLREKDANLWVSTLVEMGEEFFPWNNSHPLGKKMVEAASAWFQQAGLVSYKSRKPTVLVDLFKKFGGDAAIGWEIIWLNLANNAILIKWLILNTPLGISVDIEKLADLLKVRYPELGASSIKGGLAALKDMVSKSPIGGDDGFIQYMSKGKSINKLTRISKSVQPLTILYGLYFLNSKTGNSTFTVNGLLDADMNSAYVSPLIVFGIPSAEFKRICEGLHSRYPDYIATTFTHGNDEIRIYPERFNVDDVIALAIKEG